MGDDVSAHGLLSKQLYGISVISMVTAGAIERAISIEGLIGLDRPMEKIIQSTHNIPEDSPVN